MKKFRLFFMVALVAQFFLHTSPCFAQDGVARICDLQEVIVNGFNFIIAVFPFLGLGVLILGTVFWITSQGDPQKLQKARDTLTYGVLGFVLGLSAVLIVGTIEVFLLDVENFRWIDEEGNFQFVQVGICEVEGKDLGATCVNNSECTSGCCLYDMNAGRPICQQKADCD